jgi:hypothetical protein
MPRRDIGLLDYQPVVFRLVEPNTDSIADNFTDEEVTLYDKILGKCRVFGSQWCQSANLNDPINMQWKASEVGVNRKTNTPYVTSTVTSVATNKLIDTTQTFSGAGGAPPQQYLVLNTATGQSAWITARDSATQLSLNADIFTSPSEPYTIFNLRASTNGWSLLAPNVVSFAGGISGSTLQVFNNAPSINTLFAANRWNRVTFRVTQYNYGAFTLIVNGPSGPLATYNVASAGEFEFYVWGETSSLLFNQFLTINVPTDFSGTIDFSQLEVYECNHSYTISALDLSGNFIAGQTITYGDSAADLAMLTGNVVYNGTWADFTNECGCVRLALTDNGNPPECEDELIPDPNFETPLISWNYSDETIFVPCEAPEECSCGACITAETMEFANIGINLLCPLEIGREYCVTIDVCNVTTGLGDFAEVGVSVFEGGGQVIGNIPATSSAGVYTFTFTPTIAANYFYIIFNDLNLYGCVNSVNLAVCEPASPYYALSECFKLCAPACSTTISYRNPVNAYGLNYEHDPNFRLFTRNQARIINQSIRDNALSVFKTGSGVGSNPYHDGLRVADFNQGPAPAYYHMVLATALAHSDCKVDGVLVQRISEYSPDFSDAFELSRATTEVQFKNQRNLRKTL